MAEETTLRLQQVICPSCKRPLNTFNPNKLLTECPYCHSKLVNPLVKPKDVPVPERILTFTYGGEKCVEEYMKEAIINNDYIPTDIFDKIRVGEIVQAYLPMYLFEGSYKAAWRCETLHAETVDGKSVSKWRPENGNAVGNFSFMCLANISEDIPKPLRDFTKVFPYDSIFEYSEYTDDAIDFDDEKIMTFERDVADAEVWDIYGKDHVENMAQEAAVDMLGGSSYRNLRVSTSYSLNNNKGIYVYAPFWYVPYEYENEKCSFVMIDTGEHQNIIVPIDLTEKNYVKRKKLLSQGLLFLLLLPLLVWYFLDFTWACIDFFCTLIGLGLIHSALEKQIENRLSEAKAKRQAGAERL